MRGCADNAIIIREWRGEMTMNDEPDRSLDRRAGVLGHADRRAGLMDYCRGGSVPRTKPLL